MLQNFFRIHYLAVLAVIGSLLGAMLMFLIGLYEVLEAFLLFFRFGASNHSREGNH